MRAQIGRLLAPMAYLQVRHPTKQLYDYWLPAVLGTIAAALVLFAGVRVNVFGDNGIVYGVNQLLQLLVGFYVAALAAVATFQSDTMDEPTSGDPLVLGSELLTRRRFVCLLFGHLAVVGFMLYVAGAFALASAPGIHDALGARSVSAAFARDVFTWIHMMVAAHVVVVTLHGVHFLAVRMHTIPARPTATRPPPPLKEVA